MTSAGRRIGLVRAFQTAVAERGGRVVAADMDPLAPALYVADQAVQVPPVNSDEYVAELGRIVEHHNIELIVPTIDPELPVLAAASEALSASGCTVLASKADLIDVSSDKLATAQRFEAFGFRLPRWWIPEDLDDDALPDRVFVKPRRGSASAHTYATRKDDLDWILSRVPDPIVQEHVDAPEITIDALLDLEGRPLHFVPRSRIRVLAGESIQGVTLPDTELRAWVVRALAAVSDLGGIGPITLQAFLTDGEPTLSEINPRFGGGFPLTNAAGGRYPEWLMQMVAGEHLTPSFGDYQVGLYMTRAATEYYTSRLPW